MPRIQKGCLCFCLLLALAGRSPASEIETVRRQVAAWGEAWQRGAFQSYADFYGKDFLAGGLDRRAWLDRKKNLFDGPGERVLSISDVRVALARDYAEAHFVQHYQGPKAQSVGEKTLIWAKSDVGWKIVSERWRPLPSSANSGLGAGMRPSPPVAQDAAPADELKVEKLTVSAGTRRETLQVDLNRFAMPRCFTLEKPSPRIVIDISDMDRWEGKYTMPVNGRFIRQIRSFLHRKDRRLRIVMDLEPDRDYTIEQRYDLETHRYSVAVAEAEPEAQNP